VCLVGFPGRPQSAIEGFCPFALQVGKTTAQRAMLFATLMQLVDFYVVRGACRGYPSQILYGLIYFVEKFLR